jgi:hypothetical protein
MNIITKQYNNAIINFDLSNDLMINLTEMAKANGKLVADFLRLKSTASEMDIDTIDVFDQNYGKVKAYHKDVWLEA